MNLFYVWDVVKGCDHTLVKYGTFEKSAICYHTSCKRHLLTAEWIVKLMLVLIMILTQVGAFVLHPWTRWFMISFSLNPSKNKNCYLMRLLLYLTYAGCWQQIAYWKLSEVTKHFGDWSVNAEIHCLFLFLFRPNNQWARTPAYQVRPKTTGAVLT